VSKHDTEENRQIIAECRQAFAGQFMQPRFYRGADNEMMIMEAGLDHEDEGIYCRLSADGYMDCTDLSGPFETVREAADHLIETYGDEWVALTV
jgi:hypothetical protein